MERTDLLDRRRHHLERAPGGNLHADHGVTGDQVVLDGRLEQRTEVLADQANRARSPADRTIGPTTTRTDHARQKQRSDPPQAGPHRPPATTAHKSKDTLAALTPSGAVMQPPLPAPDIYVSADVALDTGTLQTTGEIVLVPDVVAVADIANNYPPPGAWRLRRGDGREVLIYRCPDQVES
jgi:hypothetical protein